MKKVQEKDLRRLIEILYRRFICECSTDEYKKTKYEGEDAYIGVDSTLIEICWREKYLKYEKGNVENFSIILEQISLGNLKMIFHEKDKIDDEDVICIYIANAYEVIE